MQNSSASPNIILVGFPGTGKTAVGREVARLHGWGFVDNDVEIVRRSGRPIEAIFAQDGEPAFRRHRTHVAAARTIGMDMDYGGPAGLARLAEDVADGLVPPPHLVVQTSHGFVGQGDRRQYHQEVPPVVGGGRRRR